MIQGLVNSFGASVMAAFAAAVKIDSFAYMPAIDRIGVLGIWWAIPIGWILADSVGLLYLKKLNQREKQSLT